MTNDELAVVASGHGADARYARRVLKRRAAAASRGGSADFGPLEGWLDELASRIAPGERKRLAGLVATDLRAAQARRIRANVQPPDDAPMAPRKLQADGKRGKSYLRSKRLRDETTRQRTSVKSERMFRRATAPRYLRKESSTGEAAVGFVGAMARIMRVHQYGLEDGVSRAPGAPRVRYPARVVLGFEPADRERVLEQVMGALAG